MRSPVGCSWHKWIQDQQKLWVCFLRMLVVEAAYRFLSSSYWQHLSYCEWELAETNSLSQKQPCLIFFMRQKKRVLLQHFAESISEMLVFGSYWNHFFMGNIVYFQCWHSSISSISEFLNLLCSKKENATVGHWFTSFRSGSVCGTSWKPKLSQCCSNHQMHY